MLDDYALASDVRPSIRQCNGWLGQDDCESSNRKITQLVRLAALECAKTTNLRAVPARALPDLCLGIVSKVPCEMKAPRIDPAVPELAAISGLAVLGCGLAA